MFNPNISEAFGTITPFSGAYKIGLDNSYTPTVKAVPKGAVAKVCRPRPGPSGTKSLIVHHVQCVFQWTVQNFDNAPDCYRLFVNDGKRDYALNAPEDKTSIFAFEGSPTSSDSHVWYIFRFPDGYY